MGRAEVGNCPKNQRQPMGLPLCLETIEGSYLIME